MIWKTACWKEALISLNKSSKTYLNLWNSKTTTLIKYPTLRCTPMLTSLNLIKNQGCKIKKYYLGLLSVVVLEFQKKICKFLRPLLSKPPKLLSMPVIRTACFTLTLNKPSCKQQSSLLANNLLKNSTLVIKLSSWMGSSAI